MESELYINKLKETYKNYLKTIKGRKNLYSRAMSAIINDKSPTIKLCLTITREIFEEENNPCYLFLDDAEISNKLLELLKKGIEGEVKFEEFRNQFFSLSKVFKFIYEISKLYSGKEEYWGEFINLFLFKKKFKSEYLYSKSLNVGKNKIFISYDNFIEKIKNEYVEKKEPQDEFKKIFVDSNEGTEQIIDLKKEPEKIKGNSEINNQNNKDKKSKDDIINKISTNGNGLNTKESKAEINNKINENQNVIHNHSHESELYLENKEENIENNNQISIQDVPGFDKIIESNTVYNYLKRLQYNYYKYNSEYKCKNNYESYTPILDKIIKLKLDFKYKDVGYYSKELFNPNYKLNDITLLELIDKKLKINKCMGDKNKFGYFLYELDGRYIEALYSIIDSLNLFNYSKIKDIKNYEYPIEFIGNLNIKSKHLTLEYYINVKIFFEKYKVIQYPTIIFPLGEFNKSEESLKNEAEIDGAFLVDKPFSIINSDFPFNFQLFLEYSGSNKMFKINNEDYDINGKKFLKNDLCLLEIKTNFSKIADKDNFSDVLFGLLKKMIIFEQLFTYLGIKYDRIRLILFHDFIKKKNCIKIIRNTLKKFGKQYRTLSYLDKIYMQVIYINSSYLVESLISNSDRIKNLEEALKILIEKENIIKKLNQPITKGK